MIQIGDTIKVTFDQTIDPGAPSQERGRVSWISEDGERYVIQCEDSSYLEFSPGEGVTIQVTIQQEREEERP